MEGRKYQAQLIIDMEIRTDAAMAALQRTIGWQPWMSEFESEVQAGMWDAGPKIIGNTANIAQNVQDWLVARDTGDELAAQYGSTGSKAAGGGGRGLSDLKDLA
jgi:hypothetical protein